MISFESTDVQQGCQDNPVGKDQPFEQMAQWQLYSNIQKNEAGTLPCTTHKKLTQKRS